MKKAKRQTRPRSFDHDLARWMRRAGIPCDVIGPSLGVTPSAVTQVTGKNRIEAAARREAARRAALTKIAWCPDEMREAYRDLSRKCGAKEARRMIEAEIARQARRAA